jgi:REP element-mobilizing transposase RayT
MGRALHAGMKPSPCRQKPYFHAVARTRGGFRIFQKHPRVAEKCWKSLRKMAPDRTLACVLMPDHLHWVLHSDDPESDQHRLAIILGMGAKSAGCAENVWETVPKFQVLPDRKHLRRTIRYVALNPCRSQYAEHPLQWRWNSLLDLCGGVPEPWIQTERMAHALGEEPQGARDRLLDYIMLDSTVRRPRHLSLERVPIGSSIPDYPHFTLEMIHQALVRCRRVEASSPLQKSRFRARLALHASLLGWRDSRPVAAYLGVRPGTVRKQRSGYDHRIDDPGVLNEHRALKRCLLNPDWGTLQ